ncbi:MAG: helix-turn-helix transcriptional regulator [Clostridia bacterium]|nr:helix-turn-helix transcriptional regulator [Clostridia bacterium]
MKDLNSVVARNLIKFRNLEGLSQKELAEKIHYSDKTISKWEKGDSLPDLAVLVKLSEIYKININEFLNEKTKEQEIIISKKFINKQHILVSLLSVGLVGFLSAIVFFILFMIDKTEKFAYLSFVYSFPVCSLIMFVFSIIWWNNYVKTIFCSLTMWGVIFAICFTFNISKIWILCVVGAVFQIVIIMWFILKDTVKKRKNT